uniref:Uncharacterized protein n=1 Tax=Pantoea phage Survivor TaxID=3232176 RepID=A0AAU8L0M1_9CAUD
MKIKLDKELIEKLSVVAVQAVYAAIKDNKMSLDFGVDDIKGVVYVRQNGFGNKYPGTETYYFSVKLFDNIILTENGVAIVGYKGDAIGDAQDHIRGAIHTMINSTRNYNDPSADLIKQVHSAIAQPGNKTIHNPVEGVEVTFQYLQVKRDDGLGDNTSFETVFTLDGQPQAQFTQFGNCSMAVNPLHTGVMAIIAPQIQQLLQIRKSPDFYITEHTSYNPNTLLFSQPGPGMLSANGGPLFNSPLQYGPGQRGGFNTFN